MAVAAAACARGAATPADAAVRVGAETEMAVVPTLRSEAEVRELDIAFYTERAARDPGGATDLARLAGLYLQRSRDTGDPRDAELAEEAARRSLHSRGARNEAAAQVLVSSLLAQHRFADALVVAKKLSAADPDVPALRATVGEIEMELGRYDSARVTFASLRGAANDLSVLPRIARWAEVEGRIDEALVLLRRALDAATKQPTLPREQVAWYWLRVGDLELRSGRPDAAEAAYEGGLRTHPGDYRLLAAMAHAAAVRHRWRDAVSYGEQAVAANLDPATLGILSDAYAALGDTTRSAEYARVLDVAVLRQPGAYHRAWSLFLLDHDLHVAAVYRKVREELRTRRDVYGYDLLAWALYKQGRCEEAGAAMDSALSQGTQDATLFFHAGMIARAAGRGGAAREYLTKALALNPTFDAMHPAVARAVLDSLATAAVASR